jgi:carbon-monoxide dehydrogenase large subunit
VDSQVVGVFTNKVPTAAYRGAGRPEATYILERTMDRIAHELGLDPAEVRRRNFISQEAFPYKTVTGAEYDSGNYQAALDRALVQSARQSMLEQPDVSPPQIFNTDEGTQKGGVPDFV